MPQFATDKYKALALLLVFLGGLDSGASLSTLTAAATQINNLKNVKLKPKVSPPQKQSKQWRYSKPKTSRWDIRHTKSFRFELQTALSLSTSTRNKTTTTNNNNILTLPMHKKPRESLSHVMGKGILWALFQAEYGVASNNQTIWVETPIPQEPRFVPDVVAFDVVAPDNESSTDRIDPPHHEVLLDHSLLFVNDHAPTFWGESGRMSAEKAAALAWKYPHTHFVHLRWGSRVTMDIFEEIETAVLPSLQHRTAPFQFALLSDKPQCFVEEDGTMSLRKEDLQWRTARFDIDLDY